MTEGLIAAAKIARKDAAAAARYGASEGARYLEAHANNLQALADAEATEPTRLVVCVNCKHPTPAAHVPPRR